MSLLLLFLREKYEINNLKKKEKLKLALRNESKSCVRGCVLYASICVCTCKVRACRFGALTSCALKIALPEFLSGSLSPSTSYHFLEFFYSSYSPIFLLCFVSFSVFAFFFLLSLKSSMLSETLFRTLIPLLLFSSILTSPLNHVRIHCSYITIYATTDHNPQNSYLHLTFHKQDYETYLETSHRDDYVLFVNTTLSPFASSFACLSRRVPLGLFIESTSIRSTADPLVPGPVLAFIIVLALGTCMF